jgi:polyisoprenoid-binding protein YceI
MTWKIDSAHSEINFTVRHMMISNVRGSFENFTGNVELDMENPQNSSVEVQIETSSINTREPKRDAHLKSADFFDVENYPVMTFKSNRIEVLDENRGHIHGDLTIKDVTKPVVLDVTYAGQAKSPWGATSAGFSATTKINRKDWELTWNVALETGGWLVGEEIKIELEMELVKQEESEAVSA